MARTPSMCSPNTKKSTLYRNVSVRLFFGIFFQKRKVTSSLLEPNYGTGQLKWSFNHWGRANETFLMWVPKHLNIAGSGEVNWLARQKSSPTTVQPKLAFEVRGKTVKSLLKNYVARVLAIEWSEILPVRIRIPLWRNPKFLERHFTVT